MQFSGKTVEEAIANGLRELNAKREDVEVVVLEQPSKGLFGILKKKAVVDLSVKQTTKQLMEECFEQQKQNSTNTQKPKKKQAVKAVKEKEEAIKDNSKTTVAFIEKVLKHLDIEAEIQKKIVDNKLVLTLSSSDSSYLIGKQGEILDAIQTLAGAVENIGNKTYKKVVVDCENYRCKREDSLINLAKKLEKKATEMKREVILEPMSPYERRIIHTTLAESETVTTRSDGKEPNRYVVIVPNEADPYAKPYIAARNGSKPQGRGSSNGRSRGNGKGNGYAKRGNKPNGYKKFNGGSIVKPAKKTITFGTYLGNSKDLEGKEE